MSSDDITVRILIEIRDELRATNARIDGTNVRIDATNAGLRATNERVKSGLEHVGNQLVDADLRAGTRWAELCTSLDLRDRVERCEAEIEDLKHRGR